MADDLILETRELSKQFAGFTAVSGVNLRFVAATRVILQWPANGMLD